MKRTEWIVGMRNKLSMMAMECDSAAAIERTRMSRAERESLQKMLREATEWIDKRIMV